MSSRLHVLIALCSTLASRHSVSRFLLWKNCDISAIFVGLFSAYRSKHSIVGWLIRDDYTQSIIAQDYKSL